LLQGIYFWSKIVENIVERLTDVTPRLNNIERPLVQVVDWLIFV